MQNRVIRARRLNMKTWYSICLMGLLFAIGCKQLPPQSLVGQKTVTVSGNDPFVDMEDGTRIAVDAVPADQSMQFMLTQYRDSNGKIAVDVDNVSERDTTNENE
jgi:hypothetical protein